MQNCNAEICKYSVGVGGEAGPSYKGLSKIETDLRLYCVTDESLCQL